MASQNVSQRARQKAATRERIIDGLVGLLATGNGEISVEALATAVGVSQRTVYVHFPDRAALLTALDDRVNRELLYQPEYGSPEDLIEKTADEYRDACAHAGLLLAQLRSPLGAEVRARSRADRAKRVEQALAPLLEELPSDFAERALAVILHLRGADTWRVLHEDLHLDAEQGAAAIEWALSTLIADIRRRADRS